MSKILSALPLRSSAAVLTTALVLLALALTHSQSPPSAPHPPAADQSLYVLPDDKPSRPSEISRPRGELPTAQGAAEFRRLQLQDENGNIPADGLINAAAHMRLMRSGPPAAQGPSPQGVDGGGISRASWTWLGPGNVGGRLSSILFHPAISTTIWVGSLGGGIWKTTDGGARWDPVQDFMASLMVTSLVINPVTRTVLYAGTGDLYTFKLPGEGVFRSLDGGNQWEPLASTNPIANDSFRYMGQLAISPNGKVILAGTQSGIWRSVDGGANWNQAQVGGNPLTDPVTAVQFHPTNSDLAVAGGRTGPAWYSSDGGANWTVAGGIPDGGRVVLAYARSNPTIVFASVNQNRGEIWRSADGGQSYTRVNTGNNFLGNQGYLHNALWVDPTNADTVVVGGLDLWRGAFANDVVNLTKISDWRSEARQRGSSVHADHLAIVSHPGFNGTTNKTVYFGNDGGIYKTDDIYAVQVTEGWTILNNNLGVTQFYGAAAITTTSKIAGGAQDNGTLISTGEALRWNEYYGGDGGYQAADPSDARYIYGEYVYLAIHRSSNGGASGEYIYGKVVTFDGTNWVTSYKPAPFTLTDVQNSRANFIAPFILDPNNPNRLLGGGFSLWRTDDAKTPNTPTTGPTWAAIKAPIGTTKRVHEISAIAVAPGNSDIVWVGHNNGELYKTVNGTAAAPDWTRIGAGTLPARMVTRITVYPRNADIVYVTFGGFSADNVWRTSNGGTNWNSIVGTGATGLPRVPVLSLVIHPNNSSWLYVGTEVGIFTSENSGADWFLPHDGPSNVSVQQLFWINNSTTVGAATYGRGIYKADTAATAPTCYSLTTTSNPAAGGSINASAPNCNATQYLAGTVVTVTANAAAGFAFNGWSGDLSGAANPTTLTMNGNKSVTANFLAAATCYTLTLSATNGRIDASPVPNCNNGTQYTDGTVVSLRAVPNTGYVFVNWSGDASGSANPTSVTMNGAKSVTANFAVACYNLTTSANPTAGGIVIASPPNCNVTQYTHGTVVTLTATASPGFTFGNWSGDASGSANPTTITMNSAKSATANFTSACYTLTLNAANGSISPSPAPNCNNGTQYTSGTTVALTATANSGYNFTTWSGDAGGSTNPTTVTMDGNKSVTANFSVLCYPLMTFVEPGAGGSISVNPPPNCMATRYAWGSTVQVTGNPNAGYNFVLWRGSAMGSDRTASVIINGTEAVTATFAPPATNDPITNTKAITLTTPSVLLYLPIVVKPSGGASSAQSDETTRANAPLSQSPVAIVVYSDLEDTRTATNDPGDPVSCTGSEGRATVWYKFIAPITGTLHLDTTGSSYDTLMTVWEGSPGNLNLDACDDDTDDDVVSVIDVPVVGGVTYYIEVADGSEAPVSEDPDQPPLITPAGGLLKLRATFTR